MSQEFHAIYEQGVLRPLTPLDLPEHAEVTVILQACSKDMAPVSDDPLLGSMADDAELLDEIVADAMAARATRPFRANE